MRVEELNTIITLYYLENIWNEEKGQDEDTLVPLFDFDVFANVGNVSYTSQFKLMEQGHKHVKRVYTLALMIDDKKTIIIKHDGKKYKVLRVNDIKNDKNEVFFEYDVELMNDER